MRCLFCQQEFCYDCLKFWKGNNCEVAACRANRKPCTRVEFTSIDDYNLKSRNDLHIQRKALKAHFENKDIGKLRTRLRLDSRSNRYFFDDTTNWVATNVPNWARCAKTVDISWKDSGLSSGQYSQLSIMRHSLQAVQEAYRMYEFTLVACTDGRKTNKARARQFCHYLKLEADKLRKALTTPGLSMKSVVAQLEKLKSQLRGIKHIGV